MLLKILFLLVGLSRCDLMTALKPCVFSQHYGFSDIVAHMDFADCEASVRRDNFSTILETTRGSSMLHVIQPHSDLAFRAVEQAIFQRFNRDENNLLTQSQRIITFLCPSPASGSSFGCNVFQSIQIPVDAEVYFTEFHWRSFSDATGFYEVYTVGNKTLCNEISLNFNINSVGVIDSEELLRIAHRRKNLNGMTVKVVAQEDDSYGSAFVGRFLENGSYVFQSGYVLNPLADFQTMLNFTFIPIAGKGWIGRTQGGANGWNLTGMGQQVMSMEADLSISNNVVVPWRAEQIYFLPTIDYEEGFVFYRDLAAVPSSSSMIRPFSERLWIGIALTYVLLCAVFITFIRILRRYSPKTGDATEMDSILFTFSSMACQGYDMKCRARPLRITLLSSLLTGYLIQCVYNASIIAFLFVPSSFINSADDLPLYGYTTITNPNAPHYATSLFNNPSDEEELLKNSRKFFKNFDDSIKKLLDATQNFAFVCADDEFYARGKLLKLKEDNLCGFSSIRNTHAGRVKEAMVLRRGSPLRELLTHRTLKIIENGLMHRYISIHDSHTKITCDQNKGGQRKWRINQAVTLRQCTVAFSFCLAGACLSIVILYGEKLFAKREICKD